MFHESFCGFSPPYRQGEHRMRNMNLMLKFKLGGEDEFRVRGAARIKVDASGLTLTDAETGATERIPLGTVEVLSIHSLCGARMAA